MKKKIICIVVIIAICAGLFIVCLLKKQPSEEEPVILESSYSREAFLNIKGWDVSEISSEAIKIPEDFDGVYSEYAQIQEDQKLPLKQYKGKEVTRFLYSVNNGESENRFFAELLISENRLVAAAIIKNNPDGAILPLTKKPANGFS